MVDLDLTPISDKEWEFVYNHDKWVEIACEEFDVRQKTTRITMRDCRATHSSGRECIRNAKHVGPHACGASGLKTWHSITWWSK